MRYWAPLAAATLALVLFGCQSGSAIVGTWSGKAAVAAGHENDPGAKEAMQRFQQAPPKVYQFNKDGSWSSQYKSGTWAQKGNTIVLDVEKFEGKSQSESQKIADSGADPKLTSTTVTNAFAPIVFTLSVDGKSLQATQGGTVLVLTRQQ